MALFGVDGGLSVRSVVIETVLVLSKKGAQSCSLASDGRGR